MRSNRTVAEYEAAAMLLGYEYDLYDHTYCVAHGLLSDAYLDADTLEELNYGDGVTWPKRRGAVKRGELGASDALDHIMDRAQS